MPESVYQMVEFVGSSKESWEEAARNAITMARKKYSDLFGSWGRINVGSTDLPVLTCNPKNDPEIQKINRIE